MSATTDERRLPSTLRVGVAMIVVASIAWLFVAALEGSNDGDGPVPGRLTTVPFTVSPAANVTTVTYGVTLPSDTPQTPSP